MPTIVHFELPADNVERAKKFYTELFDWKIEKVQGNIDYWEISTLDNNGERGISGGIMQRQPSKTPVTNYVDVPSVEEYSKRIERLGGKILNPKTAVPQMGYFAIFHDTEQNVFGIWETNDKAQ